MLALLSLYHDATTPVMKNTPKQDQDCRRQPPTQAILTMSLGEVITEETYRERAKAQADDIGNEEIYCCGNRAHFQRRGILNQGESRCDVQCA